jgi:membrane-anchored protein YejM (alkaline phosphatase superfamily)
MVDSGNTYSDKVSRIISWGHWFSFFNIIAAMMIGTRYIIQSDWPDTFISQLYLCLSWVGHFGFLVFAIYVLVLFPLSFIVPSQRLMRFLSVVIGTLGLTILLLDTHSYQQIHLHLSPLVWELLLSKEKTEINSQWQYLFIVVPIIFLLQLMLSEWVWTKLRKLSHKQVGKPIAIIFFVSFIGSHLIHIWADANIYRPITSQRSNFPLSYPMTAKTFMEKYGLLDKQEYQRLREAKGAEGSELIRYPIEPLSFKDQGHGYNVMVVMVDSLRSDMLTEGYMPNLWQFSNQNINFSRHYSTSNDMSGVFGLFYGLPGGYSESIKADGASPLLLQTLTKRKYNFGLFSGSNFDDSLYYQSIFSESQMSEVNTEETEQTDTNAIEDWATWLAKQPTDESWFSYLELETVADYEELSDIDDRFTPEKSTADQILSAKYKNAVAHLDSQLGSVIESLRQSEQYQNTVIIITSNHGMEFNDTNTHSWGANSNYSKYQLQVPLVVHWPNKEAQVIERATSHLDVVPTLMEDVLNVSSDPKDYSSGINLFDDKSNRSWIIAGDSREIALITKNNTTVIDKFGNYKVYDENYQRLQKGKPKLSLLMQGLSELKRFYHPDEK